ncbi:MAG TPA: efflux RND transporter periplasmic adaptor subunit [Gemmatimonadaceae bacterium]|jgi:HlyD family secretion protein|nr:efflux RND transporter periplasmic adaptor subunit [Gemmatimonadaceae bacterium]
MPTITIAPRRRVVSRATPPRRTTVADSSRVALASLVLLAMLVACHNAPEPDAYGNFESIEVVVSAQTSGQIERFVPVEGMRLERGDVVALIDTTQLSLERAQLVAQRAAVSARRAEVGEQLGVLRVQRDIAKRAYERAQRLHAQQAATTQQLDQAERDYKTLVAQIDALEAQRRSVTLDVASNQARVEQIADRLAKSSVVNPRTGSVLAVYARAGEVVQPGQPLYKIADLDTLDLRAYVTGDQLASVRLGERVAVHVDRGDGQLASMAGTVTWVSSTAEFTPTPVQTRDERADLVYAVKIRVANPDGALKIGMPADVSFGAAVTDTARVPVEESDR